jgi:hypothetical protein
MASGALLWGRVREGTMQAMAPQKESEALVANGFWSWAGRQDISHGSLAMGHSLPWPVEAMGVTVCLTLSDR